MEQENIEYQNIVEYCPNFEVCRSILYKAILDCHKVNVKRC